MANTIDPRAQIGAVHLNCAHLEQQVSFYQNLLGFQVLQQQGDSVWLGAAQNQGPLSSRALLIFDSDEKWGAGARHNRALPLCHPGTFAARVGVPDTADHAQGRYG